MGYCVRMCEMEVLYCYEGEEKLPTLIAKGWLLPVLQSGNWLWASELCAGMPSVFTVQMSAFYFK